MGKTISIVAGCYNEADNISELYTRLCSVADNHKSYRFEFILIDNCSEDGTFDLIKRLSAKDKRLKAIKNTRNFGHIRSPYYALLRAKGDAVIGMASDLEDPPELINEFIEKWESGYKVVIGVRKTSEEKGLMPWLRSLYYRIIKAISDVDQVSNYTGFGLYDSEVIKILRDIDDPYPYFRGLICELGYRRAEVPFDKPVRRAGISKGNFFVYLDSALLGIVNHTKAPLRASTLFGSLVGLISFVAAIYVLIQKLMHWEEYQLGLAPLSIGVFFLLGIIFIILGLIGEYIGLLVTHVVKKPMVVVDEEVNFDD